MPCLELKVAAEPLRQPATRLRNLLERPGAAVLRRQYVAEAASEEDAFIRNRLRVAAVLAVDLTNPPQEPEPPAADQTEEAAEAEAESSEDNDTLASSFAKGLEIWVGDGVRAVSVLADVNEIPGALAMFDAYLRLARYQPAFTRLDRRIVGLTYGFREGLSVGVQGSPSETEPTSENFFDVVSPVSEVDDFRAPCFVVRLPGAAVGYLHDLLRSASAWLQENSYTNILGSK
jgi:hypothetical protein